jgi:hypothetical protein
VVRVKVLAPVVDGLLSFTAADVHGVGRWVGANPPAAGVEVEVELTVPREIPWEEIALDPGPTDSGPPGAAVIDGLVEDFDHDGVLVLRVVDGIVLVDTKGVPPLAIVGRRLRLTPDVVEIYPVDI